MCVLINDVKVQLQAHQERWACLLSGITKSVLSRMQSGRNQKYPSSFYPRVLFPSCYYSGINMQGRGRRVRGGRADGISWRYRTNLLYCQESTTWVVGPSSSGSLIRWDSDTEEIRAWKWPRKNETNVWLWFFSRKPNHENDVEYQEPKYHVSYQKK